jgi:hypothetical protein
VHGAAGWLKPGVPRALGYGGKGMRHGSEAEAPREIANGCLKFALGSQPRLYRDSDSRADVLDHGFQSGRSRFGNPRHMDSGLPNG